MQAKVLLFAFIATACIQSRALSTPTYQKLNADDIGHATLKPKEKSYWKFWVPEHSLGVLTLHNAGQASDFKIKLYQDATQTQLLTANNTQLKKSLLTTPVDVGSQYVYVEIANVGSSSSTYRFVPHHINLGEHMGNAFVTTGTQHLMKAVTIWLFDIKEEDKATNRNVGRIVNLSHSFLSGKNFSEMSKSYLKKEIKDLIREQLGGGFIMDWAMTFIMNVVESIYQYMNINSLSRQANFIAGAAVSDKAYTPVSDVSPNTGPEETVRKFITYLGKQHFKSAYRLTNNSKWYGSYERFSSKQSYGGITQTKILSFKETVNNGKEAWVYIDYYAYDPANSDGRYKQTFLLHKTTQGWKIVEGKLIDRSIF